MAEDPWTLCKNTKWADRIGTPENSNLTLWICNCPDNTKRIDDKWCRPCSEEDVCCGIKLNTNVPFIGNCIELSKWDIACKTDADCSWGDTCVFNEENYKNDGNDIWICISQKESDQTTVTDKTAFPVLMWWLTKILVTIIILAGFIGILAGGVMISSSGGSDEGAKKGKDLIIRVIIALALLGASGVILRLINPNFFG